MNEDENIEHYRNQIMLARTEIKNLRQQISALKHEHQKEIKQIKCALNNLRCGTCHEAAATVVVPNGVSHQESTSTSAQSGSLCLKPIGVIETTFQNKRGVPRQPTVLSKALGTLVIDPTIFNNPEHALSGLDEFSHMWIIFHFHALEGSSTPAKVAPPRLQGERRGVFATRAPRRPCPIGLSLVKIQRIEGNKIHFFGVDMVNGTPVLDIKPYIPQYDYPPTFEAPMSLVRPPTEGNSDAAETMASLQIDDEQYDSNRLSPRLTNPIGIDTSSPIPNLYDDEDLPSPEIADSNLITPISPSPITPSAAEILEAAYRVLPQRLDSERGDPDGQERFTPPQSNFSFSQDGIRVAPWIDNPPQQRYSVSFTEDALERLSELLGDRCQSFKVNIESLLAEDPRSNYVRSRYPDHEYSCVLEDVSISCVFNSEDATCTIVAVRSAEDFQQS